MLNNTCHYLFSNGETGTFEARSLSTEDVKACVYDLSGGADGVELINANVIDLTGAKKVHAYAFRCSYFGGEKSLCSVLATSEG